MELEQECLFDCPYCWTPVSVLIDLSGGSQDCVQDCENCCRPIRIAFEVRNAELVAFDAGILE